MNISKYKLLIVLLLISSFARASHVKGKYEKTKSIHKTYHVQPDANIRIDNSYGNINVTGWNKNIVDIKINISASGNDLDDVIDKLKSINVELSANATHVSATTKIDKQNSNWSLISLLFGKSLNVNFKIDYEIKIPLKNNLEIINDYGNIFIDELHGNLKLNADYGKFDIGDLMGENNRISVDYFNTSEIDFIKKGSINADYSRININSAYYLKLSADYSKIQINKVRKLRYSNDYGSIKVYNSMEITGSGDYQSRYFENINAIKLNVGYGSIQIKNLRENFEKISISCDYTNLKIINPKQVPFLFIIDQEYGCFKQNGLEIVKDIQDGSDKHFEGYYKTNNTKSVIHINEDYGCIKIYN